MSDPWKYRIKRNGELFFSNPYISDSLSYKEKGFSYGQVDSHLFLGIK
jgi:hypothetical protein